MHWTLSTYACILWTYNASTWEFLLSNTTKYNDKCVNVINYCGHLRFFTGKKTTRSLTYEWKRIPENKFQLISTNSQNRESLERVKCTGTAGLTQTTKAKVIIKSGLEESGQIQSSYFGRNVE